MSPTPQSSASSLVWPLTVRIAHWSVAAVVLFNLFNESGGKTHRYAGYVAAGFVAARCLFGLLPPRRASSPYWPTPSACLAHLRSMLRGAPAHSDGHNPLGMAMAIALWTLVLLLALTGWISRWDRFWGEDWPITLHSGLSVILQYAVLAHLAGVAVSSVLERRNLVVAMITGRKRPGS